MEWNVFVDDFNRRDFKVYNIFDHGGFLNACKKTAKKFADREPFCEEIRSWLMYYFWCKCEWEVVVIPWPSMDTGRGKKIDAYAQVMLNKDRFYEYIWENRAQLLPKRGRPRKEVKK